MKLLPNLVEHHYSHILYNSIIIINLSYNSTVFIILIYNPMGKDINNMNLNQIDLNLFTIFDVIYTERNLTKAGKVLGITQPAVSNALSRLRTTFNDNLFTRTAHGMMPTPIAQNVIVEVRHALNLLRTSLQEGQSFEVNTASKTFNISMRDISEVVVLPKLIPQLKNEAPNIHITSCYIYPNELAHSLSNGYLDLAIESSISTPQNVHYTKIQELEFACMARKDHPIFQGHISLEQYCDAEHIHVTNGKEDTTYLDSALAQHNINRNVVFTGYSHLITSVLVLESDAIMTIPKTLASTYANYLDLQVMELPIEVSPLQTYMFWHENVQDDPANIWLRNKVLEISGMTLKDNTPELSLKKESWAEVS